jgi:Na+/H+-dicarboxylate symporter
MSPADALEVLYPRSLKHLSDRLHSLVKGRLWLQVVAGMLLGVGVGVAIGPSTGWVARQTATTLASWLALPGQVFLGLVQMIVIPLVFASVIRGLASSENVDQLRRAGLVAVAIFIVTTALAIALGLGLALLIRPGRFLSADVVRETLGEAAMAPAAAPAARSVTDVIGGLLPSNPLGAMVEAEMLQIVIVAAIVGVALVTMAPRQSKPLLELLGSVQEVCMTVVRWAMWLAPLAVFGFSARLMANLGVDALLGMAVYVGTVIGGLLVLLALYLVAIAAVRRQGVGKVVGALRDVLLLAFSTSSSAAVMPLTMRTAEEKLRIRPSISQFIMPLGATLNMNGTALYQGVATVFLAQVYGIDLSAGELTLVVVTAVGAAVGSPATPGVGIVILSMVLSSAGIPVAGVALIMGVDRILDMTRTTVNVAGDLFAASVVDKMAPGPSTVDDQLASEAERQRLRSETGDDVVLAPPLASASAG